MLQGLLVLDRDSAALPGVGDLTACASCRQLGIDNFEPMKPYFLDMYTASKAFLPTMPSLDSLEVSLDNNWLQEASTQPPTSPVLVPSFPFSPPLSLPWCHQAE
jgi:hypothetical protein